MDVDIIMSWQLDKIYEYMAFYMSEDDGWKQKNKQESMTQEQKNEMMMKKLMGA